MESINTVDARAKVTQIVKEEIAAQLGISLQDIELGMMLRTKDAVPGTESVGFDGPGVSKLIKALKAQFQIRATIHARSIRTVFELINRIAHLEPVIPIAIETITRKVSEE